MRSLLLALFSLFCLAACAHRIDFGPWGQIEDPERILEVIQGRYQEVSGLVGRGRLGIQSPQGSGSLRMAIEASKPGFLYLETADILGFARGTFATNGANFYFFRPDENLFLTGPAERDRIGELLPLPLSPAEMVEALLGQIPILSHERIRMELDEREGAYLIEIRSADGAEQRIRVGTRDLRLLSVETLGAPLLDARLSRHEEILPGNPFPRELLLRTPDRQTELRIRYTDIELNPSVDPSTFILNPPPDARIEILP